MSTDRKLDAGHLRKMVFAMMNAAGYQVRVWEELLAELDGRSLETKETEETETTTKKKSTSTKKKAVAEVETQEEVVENDDMFGDESLSDEPTVEDVRKIVKTFSAKHGKDKALKLLGKFKVTAIPDLKKSDYQPLIDFANKHLG